MQILMIVASTPIGVFIIALRTVVGEGSVSTAFAHGLVGPNFSANVRHLCYSLDLGRGQHLVGKVNR